MGSKADLVTLALGLATIALALYIERDIRRFERSLPAFRDRWKWHRRMALGVCIVSALLILARWL